MSAEKNKFSKRIITTAIATRDTDGKKTLVKFPALGGHFGTLVADKAFDGELSLKKDEQLVVFGDLVYEEYVSKGEKRQNLLVFVDKVAPVEADKEPSCWVNLTLRTMKEGFFAMTRSGFPWIGTWAAMSQGKDRDGNWKPSLFLDVKYFGKDEADPLPQTLIPNGTRFDAQGFLKLDTYLDGDGREHTHLVLTARKIEIWFETPELAAEPA